MQQLFEETYSLEGQGTSSVESQQHKGKLEELLVTLIQALKDHQSIETRRNSATDSLLVGLLSLIRRILKVEPQLKEIAADPSSNNLINELFRNCLFDLKDRDGKFEDYTEDTANNTKLNKNYIKCLSEDSRKIPYDLLYELCRDCPQNLRYFFTESGFLDLSKRTPKRKAKYSWLSNENKRS